MRKLSRREIAAVAIKPRRVAGRALTRARLMTLGAQGPREARLSVVVPCYNVEAYLDQTLKSLEGQTYDNLEIIVVDDGSPDNSGRIARRHARRDRRIKVIRQENGGLGAARNTGIRYATGDFITFADSDDTIPRTAYATMMRTLQRTGSDFVIGNTERKRGNNRWVPLWSREVHAVDRFNLTLADMPTVLQDVIVCNKIFRRDFFLKNIREFPVGVRYEDQVPTARAFSAARSFDVLRDIVYTWYIRDDGSSITQGKARIEDLQDRLKVKRGVMGVLFEHAPTHVFEYWLAKAIGFDLEAYFQQVPRTDADYWETLRAGVKGLAERIGPESWKLVKFHDRVKAECALRGTAEDASAVVTSMEETLESFELLQGPNGIEVSADYLSELSFEVEESTRLARDVDLQPRARVLEVKWLAAGRLELTVQAFLTGHAGTPEDAGLVVEVVDSTGAAITRAQADRAEVENPNDIAADPYVDHRYDVFRAELDLEPLAAAELQAGRDLTWQVRVRRLTDLGEFESHIGYRSLLSTAGAFPHGELVGHERLALRWEGGLGLLLNRPQPHAVATSVAIDGRSVTIEVDTDMSPHRGKDVRDLRLFHKWSGVKLHATPAAVSGSTARFVMDLPELAERYRKGAQRWRVRLNYVDGSSELLQFGGGDHQLFASARQGARLAPVLTENGFLQLEDARLGGCVSSVEADPTLDEIRIGGEIEVLASDGALEIALASSRGTFLRATRLQIADGRFDAVIPLKTSAGLLAPSDGYSLRARTVRTTADGSEEFTPWRWLPVSAGLTAELPLYRTAERWDIRVSRTEKARALWVNLYPPLAGMERGRRAARVVGKQLDAAPPAVTDAILFESYGGKSCSDSPLELSLELARQGDPRPRYFAIKDYSVAYPEGVTPVVVGSEEYQKLTRSCRWLVNNNNFPYYFRKQSGQYYLQTWHGTPLKRIGNDVPGVSLSLTYRALMRREAEYWDALLAQNEYSAKIFPSAFGYTGPVETLGYPRNDALFSGDRDQVRAAVREEFGIPEGRLVVLYAPTWRDNVKANGGAYKMVSFLDIDELEKSLGGNFVVLQRGHANTASAASVSTDPRVIDVTNYGDLNGLFLASDALITDYSSIAFDYVDTRKPVVYLVPDLQTYADVTRGFYVDLQDIAPGPLCADSAEVGRWLKDMDTLRSTWEERYAAFLERFVPLDGPDTAARVAAKLM